MSLINAHTLNHLVIPPAFLSLLLIFASTTATKDAQSLTADDAAYSVHGTLNHAFPFDQPFRLVSTGSVAHGTLRTFGQFNGFSQDSFFYEPNFAYVGQDSFTYHACDSNGNCVDGTITLNVQNGAPHAVTDEYTLHGILYGGGDILLSSNDTDPDGDPLRVVSVTQASNGSFRYFFEYDSFIYEPNYGFTGMDSVTYQVCDSFGLCDTGTVTLNVVDASPEAADDNYTVHGSLTVPGPNALLENDVDPDGDAIYVMAYSLAAHGTFTYLFFPQGSFTYTPNPGYSGPDHITYQVCDYLGLCSTARANFNVVNNAPVANPDEFTARANETLNVPGPGALTGNDSDPDGDQIHVTSLTQTSHGSVSYSFQDGSLTYQPNQNFAGLDSFTYQLCDYAGGCANTNVTIRVLANDRREESGTTSCNKSVGGPVNVTNGNVYLQQTDYQLPGVGPAIDVSRTYNSNSQDLGLFGRGWTTDYDESIKVYSATYVRWFRSDGQATNFMRASGSGPFAAVEGDFLGSLTQNGDGSFTVSFKDGRVHRFNSAGKLLSLTDISGNQTTLTYTSGKLSSITDPFGRVVTATTDTSGRMLTLTDSIGKFATYTYGTSGQLLSVTYADNSKYQFTYTTANGNLVLATVNDALSNTLENHTYDSQGRAITSERHGGVEHYQLTYVSDTETDVTDALARVTRYSIDRTRGRNVITRIQGLCSCGGGSQTQSWTYDSQMNLTSHTNAVNQTVTYTYDGNGNRLTGSGVLGTSTFTYNQFGEVLTATDAMAGVTSNTFDGAGNPLSVTDALHNATTFTYDQRGELVRMTNARGKITTLAYDNGNISQTTDALGNITKFTYDARGRLINTTDALGFKTTYAYDAAGRLNKITRADNSIVSFTYDLAGRRTKVTDPLRSSTTFAYDPAYRLTSETDALGKSVTYSYDLVSNLITATDQLGHATDITYDEFNRPVTITYPPALTGGPRLQERTEYDASGNVTKRTGTAGLETIFAYDNANRLVSVTDPLQRVTQYEYNARSNVTAVVDALNQRYTFDYDAVGHTTAATRAGLQMSFTYDAAGNQTQRTDHNNATTNYQYDALNRLTKITYPDSTTATYGYDQLSQLISAANISGSVSFVYDKMRQMTSTTDVWGQSISYVYDAGGRRTQMNLGAAKFASYTYDAINRLTKITDNANKSTSYTYDAASNLLTRALSNNVVTSYTYDGMDRLTRSNDAKSKAVIADNNYTYNDANQIIQNIDQSGAHAYVYDVLDRLTSASYPATGNESYAYDAVGNRTSSQRSPSYVYQPFNRLTNTDTAGYLYDNNGNLISKSDAAGATSFAWDFENRLTQVSTPAAGGVTYKYDALGRRVQRAPSNGLSTNFSYDGADIVHEKNSDATTVDYLNGPGVDNKIWQKGAAQYFFSQDHLGSTTALTNTSGALVERETYDAYGNTAGSALTRYGYTGRERDPLTGLQYNRARWYDSQVGRFISEDPIGLSGGVNQFSYVGNNPQNRVDPSGLYEIDVHYYLTLYLSKKTGCFKDWEAMDIANEDQATDENSNTKPGYGGTDQQRMQNRIFHDFTPSAAEGVGSPLLWQGAMNEQSDSHQWIGRYLHHLQDSFSHAGFTDDVVGHSPLNFSPLSWTGYGDHSTDKTASDPTRARRMAYATWDALVKYASAKHCNCSPKWDEALWKDIDDFINMATNHPRGSTIDAITSSSDNPGVGDPTALTQKRRILGLRDRYSGGW